MKNPFHFSYSKASQAIATLLRSEPDWKMNYYRLLKLLYIADRQSIQEIGRPIIGGRLVAMRRGPLHSAAIELVQGKDQASPEWYKQFKTVRFEITMIEDPGNGDLSKDEIEILERIRLEHEDKDDYAVGDFTHSFSEFVSHEPKDPKKVETIPFDELLEAVGRGKDAERIEKDAHEKAAFDRLFGA